MKERKHYPEDFKKEAVKLLLTSGKTQKELSSDLDIPYGMISRWRKEFDLENPYNMRKNSLPNTVSTKSGEPQ